MEIFREAPSSSRKRAMLILSIALSGVSVVFGLCLGTVWIPISSVPKIIFHGPNGDTWSTIVWRLRFPRVLLSFVEGAGLGMTGAVMQGLFRNPMADPYILGISSGASLGAVVGIVFGLGGSLGVWSLPLAAFLGALLTIGTVYRLATFGGRTETLTLLLAGIALSSLVSSTIALIMVLSRDRVDEIVFWTMGALSRASWPALGVSSGYTLLGSALLLRNAGFLNALSFGEEPAFHMGVPVERVKTTLLWTGSLVTAAGVAFTGPIGFIGLIVPHAVRLVAGPDHRWLLPLSAVTGGNALILADLLARTVAPPIEIPVGVITAMFGAPFFLILLFGARRERR